MKLIEEWRNKKAGAKKQHKKLIRKLQTHKGKRLNQFGNELHERVFSKVDCLDCANCCTSIPPMVNKTDVARIAKRLGLKVTEFEKQYLKVDEDGDTVMNQSPCPFLLADNKCFVYEFRPKACRAYPHTNNLEFSKNLSYHATNAQYCPAVFHILEEMKRSIP